MLYPTEYKDTTTEHEGDKSDIPVLGFNTKNGARGDLVTPTDPVIMWLYLHPSRDCFKIDSMGPVERL